MTSYLPTSAATVTPKALNLPTLTESQYFSLQSQNKLPHQQQQQQQFAKPFVVQQPQRVPVGSQPLIAQPQVAATHGFAAQVPQYAVQEPRFVNQVPEQNIAQIVQSRPQSRQQIISAPQHHQQVQQQLYTPQPISSQYQQQQPVILTEEAMHHQSFYHSPVPLTNKVLVPPKLNGDQNTLNGVFQLAHVQQEMLPSPQHTLKTNPTLKTLPILHSRGDEGLQHQGVLETVVYVTDKQQVDELQERIRVLLDNIQELNHSVDLKDNEISELREKLLEIDHLNRVKLRTQEENDSLKLQIEEWQKRYNVLELQMNNKYISPVLSNYSTENSGQLANSLKIKQEENEVLKTRIARLEMNMTTEVALRDDIMNLNGLIELKNRQNEEWRLKYAELERKYLTRLERISPVKQQSTNRDNRLDTVEVNQVTPNLSTVLAEQLRSSRKDDYVIFQTEAAEINNNNTLGNESTLKRGRSPHLKYNTADLFNKKRSPIISPDNTLKRPHNY